MPGIIAVVRKNPVKAFFFITFLISWSGVLFLAFSTGMPATSSRFEEIGPVAFIPFLLGPPLIGFLLLGIHEGKNGFRQLRDRLLTWRVSIVWYVLALFLVPVMAMLILGILSQFSPDYLPKILTDDDKAGLVITGVLSGIIGGGLLEELGWTGFALPLLRKKYSVMKAGLILGTLWGAWHFLPVFWGCGDASGNIDHALFWPGFFFHYAGLIPFRILMVWVYDKTASLPVIMLMHASLTAGTFFIFNISVTGWPLFIYYAALAGIFWAAVIITVKK